MISVKDEVPLFSLQTEIKVLPSSGEMWNSEKKKHPKWMIDVFENSDCVALQPLIQTKPQVQRFIGMCELCKNSIYISS